MTKAEISDRKKKNLRIMYFWSVFSAIVTEAFCEIFCLLLQKGTITVSGADKWVLILMTMKEAIAVFLVRQWLLYADYSIYQSPDHLKRHYKMMIIPMAVVTVLFICNLFFPVYFSIKQDLAPAYTPFYYVHRILVSLAFLYPLVEVTRHGEKQVPDVHRRRMILTISFFVIVLFTEFVSRHSLTAISHVIILSILFAFRMGDRRFEDKRSGFQSAEYLVKLRRENSTEFEKRPMLRLSAKGGISSLVKILTVELPKNSEVVRLSDGEFLVLGNIGDKKILREIGEFIALMTSEHDEDHPEETIGLEWKVE